MISRMCVWGSIITPLLPAWRAFHSVLCRLRGQCSEPNPIKIWQVQPWSYCRCWSMTLNVMMMMSDYSLDNCSAGPECYSPYYLDYDYARWAEPAYNVPPLDMNRYYVQPTYSTTLTIIYNFNVDIFDRPPPTLLTLLKTRRCFFRFLQLTVRLFSLTDL